MSQPPSVGAGLRGGKTGSSVTGLEDPLSLLVKLVLLSGFRRFLVVVALAPGAYNIGAWGERWRDGQGP